MSISIVKNGVRKVVADTSTMALSNLATIEGTTTASKAYAVGDFLVLTGQLYRVTQAIAQGDTITVGTNVVADNVGSELSAINTQLTPKTFNNLVFDPSIVTVNSKNIFTIGKKLYVDVLLTSNVNITASTNIANLTGGYAFDTTNKNDGLMQPAADSYSIQYWLLSSAINVKTGTPMTAGGVYQLVSVFDLA